MTIWKCSIKILALFLGFPDKLCATKYLLKSVSSPLALHLTELPQFIKSLQS